MQIESYGTSILIIILCYFMYSKCVVITGITTIITAADADLKIIMMTIHTLKE